MAMFSRLCGMAPNYLADSGGNLSAELSPISCGLCGALARTPPATRFPRRLSASWLEAPADRAAALSTIRTFAVSGGAVEWANTHRPESLTGLLSRPGPHQALRSLSGSRWSSKSAAAG